jgi:hypothetical protein
VGRREGAGRTVDVPSVNAYARTPGSLSTPLSPGPPLPLDMSLLSLFLFLFGLDLVWSFDSEGPVDPVSSGFNCLKRCAFRCLRSFFFSDRDFGGRTGDCAFCAVSEGATGGRLAVLFEGTREDRCRMDVPATCSVSGRKEGAEEESDEEDDELILSWRRFWPCRSFDRNTDTQRL